jgi:hypothetical protein
MHNTVLKKCSHMMGSQRMIYSGLTPRLTPRQIGSQRFSEPSYFKGSQSLNVVTFYPYFVGKFFEFLLNKPFERL